MSIVSHILQFVRRPAHASKRDSACDGVLQNDAYLSPEELQERFDLRLLRNAPWICAIFACNFVLWTIVVIVTNTSRVRNSTLHTESEYPFPASLILPELAFNIVLAVVFTIVGVVAHRRRESSPLVRPVAVALLTVMTAHSYLLYLAWNPNQFDAIPLNLGIAGFTLTKRRPYLFFAGCVIIAAVFITPLANPDEQYSDYAKLALASILGYVILSSRKRSEGRADQEQWQKHRRLEAGLRASETQYRAIFENSLVGVFQCTSMGRFMLVNRKLRKMLGYQSVDEMGQLSLVDDVLVFPGRAATPVLENLYDEMTEEGIEVLVRRKDSSTRIVQLHLRKAGHGAGVRIGYEGLMLDITQRVNAEEAIRTQREQVMQVARLATLGEMLAGVAHEINQPLCAIENFAGAAVRAMPESDNASLARIKYWNERITNEAARAGQIIKRLRGLFHKAKPDVRPVLVDTLIRDTLEIMEPVLRQTRVSARVQIEDKDVSVLADLVLMQQVLINLIRNACDAMGEGADGLKQVTVRAARAQYSLEISVEDTGSGLPEKNGRDIFETFVSTKPGGMGLGLAISKSIVEAHGGKIWADSLADRGTAFFIELPQVEDSQSNESTRC